MTGKKRIRWDEPYLCGMNENNGMKDESDYLKGVGMSDGIPSVPVQTRQEENGENEKSSANWSENSMRSWSGSWRKCCRIISG